MFRYTPGRRAILGLAAAAAMTLSLTACGEETGGDTAPAGTPAPSAAADDALIEKVPADIKSAGKLVIGVDATYAPNEFLDTDGSTVVGFDVDLFDALEYYQRRGAQNRVPKATADGITLP